MFNNDFEILAFVSLSLLLLKKIDYMTFNCIIKHRRIKLPFGCYHAKVPAFEELSAVGQRGRATTWTVKSTARLVVQLRIDQVFTCSSDKFVVAALG